MFEISVALAVAAIPEGLALSITIILAIGMQRILKRGSLVRKLVAAETLGSVSVLCTDKTGTLTEGMMRATEIIRADSLESISLQTENVSLPTWSLEMLEIGMLCNNASVQETQEVQEPLLRGNATECALMEIGLQKGFSYTSVQNHYPRLAEIPFDSARKYMVTSHTWSGGTYRLLLKGAPEKIISFCGFFVEQGE